jgi:hypothetical protein
VPFYQPWEITDALKELGEFFPQSGLYLTVVPTYIGGFMALSWAGSGKALGTPAGIKRARAASPNRRSRPTITTPTSTPRPSRCPNGSSGWCRSRRVNSTLPMREGRRLSLSVSEKKTSGRGTRSTAPRPEKFFGSRLRIFRPSLKGRVEISIQFKIRSL